MNDIIPIDKAGRIVLPKSIRQHFRLHEGDVLSLEVKGEAIELRPVKTGKTVPVNGVLVYVDTVELALGIDFVGNARDKRISELIGDRVPSRI